MKDKLSGWKLTKPVETDDALVNDFSYNHEFFMRNIGLRYVGQPDKPLLSFYVTKSDYEWETGT